MALTSYERLRMTHRALLSPRAPSLPQLLADLPARLDEIAAERPALKNEVDASRPSLARIAAYVAAAPAADARRAAEGVHRALAPLFPGQ